MIDLTATIVGVYGAYFLIQPDITPDINSSLSSNKQKANTILKAKPRGKLKIQYLDKQQKKSEFRSHLLAIGDKITYSLTHKDEVQATILSLNPRKNSFSRSSFSRLQILGANLDAVIILNAIQEPNFNFGFLDRSLIEAENSKIPAIIVVNKMDVYNSLKNKSDLDNTLEKINYYKTLGYKIFFEEFKNKISNKFIDIIMNKKILVLGQSGVGKSTLINTFAQEKIQTVQEMGISQKGKHTTTNPVLYKLTVKDKGYIPQEKNRKLSIEFIDMPGIREFGLQHLDLREIQNGYIEFDDYTCKFEDCKHLNEPSCSIKEAVENTEILQFRYDSYLSVVNSLQEKFKPRKGDYWRGIR